MRFSIFKNFFKILWIWSSRPSRKMRREKNVASWISKWKKKRPLIFLFKICRFQTQIKKSSSLKLIKIFGAIISELRPLMVCFEFRGELFVLFFRKWKLEKNKTFPSWENGSRAYLSFTAGVFAFAVPRWIPFYNYSTYKYPPWPRKYYSSAGNICRSEKRTKSQVSAYLLIFYLTICDNRTDYYRVLRSDNFIAQ